MKNEKIFLSIFLSAAIILSSLFPFRVTFAVAEENETETASDTVADIVTEQTSAEATEAVTTAITTAAAVTTETSLCTTVMTSVPIMTSFSKPIIQGGPIPAQSVLLTANLDDVTVNAGESTVVKLSLEDNNYIADVSFVLPDGITCEYITDSDGENVDLKYEDGNISFSLTRTTEVEIMLTVNEDVPSGVYNMNCNIKGVRNGHVEYTEEEMCIVSGYISYIDVFSITGGNITVIENPETTTAVTTSPESSTTTTTTETNLGAIVTTPNVIITSKGDSNGDGILNARDAALIAQKAAKGLVSELPEEADFNGDGVINIRDAAAIARYLASYYTSIGT